VQTVYGVWDYGDDLDDTEYLGSFESGVTSPDSQLSNQDPDVTMLEQTADDYTVTIDVDVDGDGTTDYTEDVFLRVLSSNEPDWTTTTSASVGGTCGDGLGLVDCDPNATGIYPDPVRNAGWYFDLPISGERVISDPIIRLGNVLYISFTPSSTACGVGGSSIVHEVDACSGGNLGAVQFDINKDMVIDENDLINVGTAANPIWVAPSGKGFEGHLQPPAILRFPGRYGYNIEKRYYSSSEGTIEEVTAKAAKIGLVYWEEIF
jgi:type IV pilus assembly protein PilY1